MNVTPSKSGKTGFIITISLSLALNHENKLLLESVQNTFSVGSIYYRTRDNTYIWKVSRLESFTSVILPHFYKYPLFTLKRYDLEIFRKIVHKLVSKTHLLENGISEIINLKASLNLGLNSKLKCLFKDVIPLQRKNIELRQEINPYWLTGFIEGEGCFYISVYRSANSKLGFAVQLSFIITQHMRDNLLLSGFINLLECGKIVKRNGEACDFKVNRINDLNVKIIPFLSNHPLQGSKRVDYEWFKQAVNIVMCKKHLTKMGLDEIRKIKNNMNTGRKI